VLKQAMKKAGIKGFFFVRQKRLPLILFQALSLHVDEISNSPMIETSANEFCTESFLQNKNSTTMNPGGGKGNLPSFDDFTATLTKSYKGSYKGSALISPDSDFIPDLQSVLCGANISLEQCSTVSYPSKKGRIFTFGNFRNNLATTFTYPGVYITEGNPYKVVNDFVFSSRFGSPESVKEFRFFGKELRAAGENETTAYDSDNTSILRGYYTSFVGVCGDIPQAIYNVRTGDYNVYGERQYIVQRGDNHGEFFPISDKLFLTDFSNIDI
jgi:hypothetical protein